jgi:hypothetical protein
MNTSSPAENSHPRRRTWRLRLAQAWIDGTTIGQLAWNHELTIPTVADAIRCVVRLKE